MHSLIARSALVARAEIVANSHRMRARDDITAVLVTAREFIDLPEALVRGPREWLLLGDDANVLLARAKQAAAGVTCLINDMGDGFSFIELSGPDSFGLLGIAPIAQEATGVITTRIADLRVTVQYARGDTRSALLVVERSNAEYLWAYLADRLSLVEPTDATAD